MSQREKRPRAPNYTPSEKETLLSIVEMYKHVIENKKSDSSSILEKHNAWQEIGKKFNSVSPNMTQRTVESLKKYYEHLKENIRKKMAEHRKELYKTGGGPPTKPKTDDVDDLLLSIVNEKSVYGVNSQFDCDTITPPENDVQDENIGSNNENVLEIIYEDEIEYERDSEDSDTNKGASCSGTQRNKTGTNLHVGDIKHRNKEKQGEKLMKTPKDLKRPKNKILTNNIRRVNCGKDPIRRRPVIHTLTSSKLGQKYEYLLDQKSDLLEYQKKETKLRLQSIKLDIQLKKKKLGISTEYPSESSEESS